MPRRGSASMVASWCRAAPSGDESPLVAGRRGGARRPFMHILGLHFLAHQLYFTFSRPSLHFLGFRRSPDLLPFVTHRGPYIHLFWHFRDYLPLSPPRPYGESHGFYVTSYLQALNAAVPCEAL
mmetsp:Transcript_3769/g.11856  ORF Transcript_3769/g.11856 Transcript_3769/m.11856 type:complete len:124 (+) Transcript_3769:23-394(+)